MTDNYLGPPEREEPGTTASAGPNTKLGITKPTNHVQDNAQPRLCGAAALRRRRRAADRCEPNASGVRDPWQPWRPEKLSEKQIDAAAAAAAHLLAHGYTPVFDIETLRTMWKAGHHQLVDDLRGGGR